MRWIGVYDQLRRILKRADSPRFCSPSRPPTIPLRTSLYGQAGQHSDPRGHESQAAPCVLGGSRVTAAEAAQHRSPVTSTSGPASRSQRAGARDSAGGRVEMGKRRGAESKRREGKIKRQLTCDARSRHDRGTRESRRLEVSHLKGCCRLCTRDAGPRSDRLFRPNNSKCRQDAYRDEPYSDD